MIEKKYKSVLTLNYEAINPIELKVSEIAQIAQVIDGKTDMEMLTAIELFKLGEGKKICDYKK